MSQEGKIVVKNLSKKTTNGFLEKFFGSYGKICNIQVINSFIRTQFTIMKS